MNKPTCKQLLEQLGDNDDITICSDIVHGLEYEYSKLQEKIEKALQWIDENIIIFKNFNVYEWDILSNPSELIEILDRKVM